MLFYGIVLTGTIVACYFLSLSKWILIMKKITLATVSMLFAFSINAHAGLINSSLVSEGDALITLHEETGLEWLKLSETDGMSYNEIIEAISEGGKYQGWRLPSYAEARAYTAEALKGVSGITFDTDNVTVSSPHKSELNEFLKIVGTTIGYVTSNYSSGVNGLYYDNDGGLKSVSAFRYGTDTYNGYVRYDYSTAQGKDVSSASTGFLLVSDGGISLGSKLNPEINANNPNSPFNDVPVPLISAFGMLGLLAAGRKKSKKLNCKEK